MKNTVALSLAFLLVVVGVANSATTTVSYQVAEPLDDGHATSTAIQSTTYSTLLYIGDDNRYSLPFMRSAMRFTNIQVPRHARINSAHLKIHTYQYGSEQDYFKGAVRGIIQAEAAGNPPNFSYSNRSIGTIVPTNTGTNWDHKLAWEPAIWYTSPDISVVLQEVVDRPDFSLGNAVVIIYSTREITHKYRAFYSADNPHTYAPKLEITYEYYTISGYVTTTTATPIEGTFIHAGAAIEGDVTDASGYYELKVPPGWSGTVTPNKADWGFSPASQTYNNVTSDQINQNYTAFQPKISGYVRDSEGAGVEAVSISSDNGGGSDTTDATGYYEIIVPYNWLGTVSASLAGYNFTSQIYNTPVIADQTNQDFTGFQPKISGHIMDGNGTAVEGVTVSADNGGGFDITDMNGFYEITVGYDWSGKVKPFKGGWGFEPSTKEYSNITSNQENQNYITSFTGIITVSKDGTGDLGSIQEAINASEDGFKIIVFPGGYPERINLHGKKITLCSTEPNNWSTVNSTIIDGGYSGGSVVTFSGSESSDCILEGFTIIGGSSPRGAGIYGSNSHAVIKNCVIRNHSSWAVIDDVYGAGVYNFDGKIINCIISDNVANSYKRKVYGAGLAYCDGEITNCFITNNTAKSTYLYGDTYGGGLYGCNAKIRNCLILGNSSSAADNRSYGGGLSNCNGEISNTIIWGNTADIGSQLYSCSVPSYSCIMNWSGGGIGNFNSDPLLAPNSYNLTFTSPCLDSGDPNTITAINETDIDFQPRFVGKRIDIGADEFAFQEPFFLLSNDKLDFTALEARLGPQQAVELNNLGLTALNWTSSADVNWLDIVPSSGSVNYEETETINIIIDINDLSAGNYSGQINIIDPQATNNPKVIDVNLTVIGPSLGISHNTFNFEASKETLNPSPQTLTISNSTGGGTLNWIITSDCNWIVIEPNTGAITEGFVDVMLDVDQNNIEYGNYSCQFTVNDPNAENSPQTVTVNLDVLRPMISVVPSNMDFEMEKDGADPNVQILSIQNAGYDTLNWQISVPAGCDWLSVDLLNGQSTGEVDEVILSVEGTDLDLGFYDCELTVTALDVENSPQIIPVSLHVYSEGQRHVPAEYGTIQAAIDAAVDGDEVIIQPGTYTGQGNYNIDFKGKAITVRSIEPENPSIVTATIIDTESGWHRAFYFHNDEDSNSVLTGLTITNCYGSGAIYCYQSSPTIRHCVVRECLGRGISLILSNAIIHNCTIINTMPANLDGPVVGSGIYCRGSNALISDCTISSNFYGGLQCVDSYLTIINCMFTGNKGYSFIHPYFPPFDDTSYGGGIIFQGGDIVVTNCTFSSNVADVGGAICSYGAYQSNTNNITINNSIFWENDANEGPQIAIENYVGQIPATVTISYSDVQGGQSAVYVDPCCTLEWDDGNNLDIDPCFAEPGYWHPNDTPLDANDDFWVNGDYHLKSQTGRWKPSIYIGLDPTGDGFIDLSDFAAFANSWQKKGSFIPADLKRSGFVDLSDLNLLLDNYLADYPSGEWVLDDITSPCIDVGNPASDWTEELWPHGKRTNMGAYGGIPQASMSLSTLGNKADLNNDGFVNRKDLGVFVDMWLADDLLLSGNINRYGLVNFSDWTEFAGQWLWEE